MAVDKKEYSSNDFLEPLAKKYNLIDEEKSAMLASGSQRVFNNSVLWANAYLKMAGLIENTRTGFFKNYRQRHKGRRRERFNKINIQTQHYR